VKLHRYWLRFDDPRREMFGLGLGCGVTAFTLDDAVALLEQQVFRGPLPFRIKESTEDVDVQTLEQKRRSPCLPAPARQSS